MTTSSFSSSPSPPDGAGSFYGTAQAAIHDERFGDLAQAAGERIVAELAGAGVRAGTVVDLGCGSGILAAVVGEAGFDVVGVDLSPAMVDLARARAPRARLDVGSIHDAEVPAGVVAVSAIGEVLNYTTDARAGLEAFTRLAARVRAALDPRGVFLLDVAVPGRAGPDGERTHHHEGDGWALTARVREDGKGSLERVITIFTERPDGTWTRTDEHHVLRLYEPDAVFALLRDAGFSAERLDAYGPQPSRSNPPMGWLAVLARPAVA